MSVTETVNLEPRVTKRLLEIHKHIDRMREERMGWGDDAMRDVTDTLTSLAALYAYILMADRIWIDGGTGFSFGGVISGIHFGLIARPGSSADRFDGEQFLYAPVEWSFHS